MKTIFATAALLAATATAHAETYETRMIQRLHTISPAEARTLLPEGYDIGAFQCPTVASANGNWRETPMIAKSMRRAVQAARSGPSPVSVEKDVPNPALDVSTNSKPVTVEAPATITISVTEFRGDRENVTGADAFGIGGVVFTFNGLAGQCDLWAFEDWNG